jgi:hypothetical protein
MFKKIIHDISKLDERTQLKLLRDLVEGELSYKDAVKLINAGEPKTSHRTQDFDSFLPATHDVLSTMDQIRGVGSSDTAKKTLAMYAEMSIQLRLRDTNTYNSLIIFGKQPGCESISRAAEKIRTQDISLTWAIQLLVALFAQRLYGTAAPTTSILKILTLLENDPSKELNAGVELNPAISFLQKFYDVLTHSYITNDKQEHIKTLTANLLQLENFHRAPIIKIITFLSKLKTDLNNTDIRAPKFMFFGKDKGKLPDGFDSLKLCLNDLPDHLNLQGESLGTDLSTISACLNQIHETVQIQKPKTLLRPKEVDAFWNEISHDIEKLITEEDCDIIQQLKQSSRR